MSDTVKTYTSTSVLLNGPLGPVGQVGSPTPPTPSRRSVKTLFIETKTGGVLRVEDPVPNESGEVGDLILTAFDDDKGAVYVRLYAADVERIIEFHKEQLANDAAYALETK